MWRWYSHRLDSGNLIGGSSWGGRGAADSAGPIPAAASALWRRFRGGGASATGRCAWTANSITGRKTEEASRAAGIGGALRLGAGDHHAGFSDFNILCVLAELTPRELAAAAERSAVARTGQPAPLLLTEHELQFADCFAIEFTTMQSHHRLLFGKDVIPALVVEDTFYRRAGGARPARQALALRQKACECWPTKPAAPPAARFGVHFLRALRHALLLHG